MDDDRDQEATAGTGRLLFMFLGMVVLCAVFFGLGYSLGRTSGPATTQAAEPVPAAAATGGAKPSPLNPGDGSQSQTPSSDQLTFYKSVEQKDAQPELTAKTAPASEEARLAASVGMTPATETTPAVGYTVQIAAVRRKDDANALVKALHKKDYAVFIADNVPDKLFHVQLGPFADRKEAEAMKARLVADGYKPIVKK